MSFIFGYLTFAIATAITSCVFLFIPRLRIARMAEIDNDLVNNPIFSCIVYTIISCIVAPVLFCILLFPQVSKSYMEGLDVILREKKN